MTMNDGPLPSIQAADVGTAPTQTSAKRRRLVWVLSILLTLVVLLAGSGVAAWVLYLSPVHPSSPLFQRHGLLDSIPLPDNVTFDARDKFVDFEINVSGDLHATISSGTTWIWSASPPGDSTSLAQFYLAQLPGRGWSNQTAVPTTDDSHLYVSACRSDAILLIEIGSSIAYSDEALGTPTTATAAAGGSAFAILVIAQPDFAPGKIFADLRSVLCG